MCREPPHILFGVSRQLHLFFGVPRQLLALSSALRAGSSPSLWRSAPTPHLFFGAPRQIVVLYWALRADSLTFPNPPQPQKPDF